MTIVIAVAGVVIGVFTGVLGGFMQAFIWATPWIQLPWGLVFAVLALTVLIRGAIWWAGARWAGWLLFGGWFLGTAAMAFESPSGDVALGEGARPLVYVIGSAILGAFAATLPLPRSRVAA